MPSSEPRLIPSDGPETVRAIVGSDSATAGEDEVSPGHPASLGSSARSGESRSRKDLPRLVSASDLLIDAPPWLISAGLHLVSLIILGLMIFSPDIRDELSLQFGIADSEDALGDDFEVPLELESSTLDAALLPEKVPETDPSLQTNPEIVPTPSLTSITSQSDPMRMALTGREAGMKESLLGAYGGTRGTEKAVLEGLRWLERRQQSKGLWSMIGPYTDGARVENEEAATGLALIAFQGAGFTPNGDPKHPFTRVVRRGWNALLSRQKENGDFYNSGRSTGRLYTHAICTIAICELYGMTRDEKFREPAQKAVDYCVMTQADLGGWRYFPRVESDLSVTGWFVIALQSARMAGLSLPSPTLKRISEFLEQVSRDGGSSYAYMPQDGATLSMTAEGLLCRQYLGWKHDDKRLHRGADKLIDNLPSWKDGERDVYYWYYATQVCHHMEGRHWRKWNERMRRVIPENQVISGREKGSWNPKGDRWAVSGGRLFATCMSIYMLEVYYRHLPIYQLDLLSGGI